MLPQIIDDFISEEERQALLPWTQATKPYLMPNGHGRQFKQLYLIGEVPELCRVIRERIIHLLGLQDAPEEPRFRSYLSIIDPGGYLHPHTDKVNPGYDHLRCNVFLSLPQVGGLPIVQDVTYPVKERSLLYFTPNRHLHWSEKAMDGQRTTLSYGFLIPRKNC